MGSSTLLHVLSRNRGRVFRSGSAVWLWLAMFLAGCAPTVAPATIDIPSVSGSHEATTGVGDPPEPPARGLVGILSRTSDLVEHGRTEEELEQVIDPVGLSAGDAVGVHKGGEALLDFGDQVRMRLFNDTTLDVVRATAENELPLEIYFFLEEGGFTGELTGAGNRTVYETPNGAEITVLGTTYFVIYDPQSGVTWAGNFGGRVEVFDGSSSFPLTDRQLVAIPGEGPRPFNFSRDELEALARVEGSSLTALNELLAAEATPTSTTPAVADIEQATCLTTGNVFLLTGPGNSSMYALIGSLTPGNRVAVLGGNDPNGGHTRYKVRTAEGVEGWLVSEFCQLAGDSEVPWTSFPPPFTPTPIPVVTDPPRPTSTSTTTPTPVPPTATFTPRPPTVTPTVPPKPAEALRADVSISWRLDPNDPAEAIAAVTLSVSGGQGGYRYFRDEIEQPGPVFEYRWRVCAANPVSFRVAAGDGQTVRLERYEQPPCPPTPTPTSTPTAAPNRPPDVYIVEPYNDMQVDMGFYDESNYRYYEDLALIGDGKDPEDGPLPDEVFIWTTAAGETLGRGRQTTARFYAYPCETQQVTIILTATDSAGSQSRSAATITLIPRCPEG